MSTKANSYTRIVVFGLFASMQFESIRKFLQNRGEPMAPFVICAVASVLHIGWCYLFVIHLRWSNFGAGCAMFLTWWTRFLLGSAYLARVARQEGIRLRSVLWVERPAFCEWGAFLKYGAPCDAGGLGEADGCGEHVNVERWTLGVLVGQLLAEEGWWHLRWRQCEFSTHAGGRPGRASGWAGRRWARRRTGGRAGIWTGGRAGGRTGGPAGFRGRTGGPVGGRTGWRVGRPVGRRACRRAVGRRACQTGRRAGPRAGRPAYGGPARQWGRRAGWGGGRVGRRAGLRAADGGTGGRAGG